MEFKATPEGAVILLLVALAAVALGSLFKRQFESNLPLLFYCAVMVFMASTGRGMDAPLVLCGLIATLVLRFEFMNRRITKVVWLAAVVAVAGIMFQFVTEVFGIDY